MKHYAERDVIRQGQHYINHVEAMTAEGLHSKADIAAELAHRDIEIERLRDHLSDYDEAYRTTVDDCGSPDEAHCSCVPALRMEIERLRAELDTERMRLAACGVVAMADTPESAAEARNMHPDYRSASCDDVARRVDECMRLRAQVESLSEQLTMESIDTTCHCAAKSAADCGCPGAVWPEDRFRDEIERKTRVIEALTDTLQMATAQMERLQAPLTEVTRTESQALHDLSVAQARVAELEARTAEYENVIIPSWKREEEMWREDEANAVEFRRVLADELDKRDADIERLKAWLRDYQPHY